MEHNPYIGRVFLSRLVTNRSTVYPDSCNKSKSLFYSSEEKREEFAFQPDRYIPFPLISMESITHNVKKLRFALPRKDQLTGLKVASYISARANINGKEVMKSYTPTSTPEERGYFDLWVKVYPDGVMSRHLGSLKVGDMLEVRGPIMKFLYVPNMKKELGLIAGGTGLTPMYQLIRKVLDNPEDRTKISFLFANVSPDDIMMKNELDRLQREHSDRFRVHYTVDRVPPGQKWDQEVGYISEQMIRKYMPGPEKGNEILIAVCGPPAMMDHVSGRKISSTIQGELKGILKNMGYTEQNVYRF
jgi:cytochrome-b5 reductase